jgi:hypothetical protein
LNEVDDEEEGEPRCCKDGERKCGSVTVNDYRRIPLAIRVGEVWVDIAIIWAFS